MTTQSCNRWRQWRNAAGLGLMLVVPVTGLSAQQLASTDTAYEFNDSHFHLTNYIQRGIDLPAFLAIMAKRVGHVALFGIPLEQEWSARVDGNKAPSYYLESDAPLYYYSFTDAQIAMAYKALPPEQQSRFDPMITGFNPADMYAVDHIRRVLAIFPGVFTGIGEFTIHKEFVSAKIVGGTPSLVDPAVDSVLAFAGEVGLLVIVHSDVDVPFAKPGSAPAYLQQMRRMRPVAGFGRMVWAPRIMKRERFLWEHRGRRLLTPMESSTARATRMSSDRPFFRRWAPPIRP